MRFKGIQRLSLAAFTIIAAVWLACGNGVAKAQSPTAGSGATPMIITCEGLRLDLDTTTDVITVSQQTSGGDPMRWTLAGGQPGIGRVALDGKVYTLGAGGDAPIAWTSPEPGVLNGAGELQGSATGFTVSFTLRPGGQLACRMVLTGVGAGKADWLGFPPTPIATSPGDHLVFPQWLGLLISPEGEDITARRTVYLRPWCMRFLGGESQSNGKPYSWIAIVNDSLYRSVDIWRKGGKAGYDYIGERSFPEADAQTRAHSLTLQFLDGGYVSVAQAYRAWAMRQPNWRTLTTRLNAHSPEKVGGAMLFMHIPCDYGQEQVIPFDNLIPRIENLKAIGIERAMFHKGGWNRMGYDSEYPDILPANPKCGGDEGFRRLTDAIDRLGYIAIPHDDIGIISEKAPSYDEKWVARMVGGREYAGGVYREQQYFITTGEAQAHFAARNTPEIAARFPNLKGYLYDVSTSVQPLEDYAFNPPLTKEADIESRQNAFRITRENFAGFIIGESIVDWNITYYDAGFMAEEGYKHTGDGGWAPDKLDGVIVPLWDLVHHDSLLAIRENSNHVNTKMDTEDPFLRYIRILLKTFRAGALPPSIYSDDLTLNILQNYIATRTEDCGGWQTLTREQLLGVVSRVSTWLADVIFTEAMTGHIFVDGDLLHERTTFGPPDKETVVYINSSAKDSWAPMPGLTLPPLGFLISGPGLTAYHAVEVCGQTLGAPALAAFKDDPKAGGDILAYRAFGPSRLPAMALGLEQPATPPFVEISETCKTVTARPD